MPHGSQHDRGYLYGYSHEGNIGALQSRVVEVGDKVNVERSMMMNGRLDGHIVQGM